MDLINQLLLVYRKMLLAQNIVLKVISPNAGLVNGVTGGQVAMSYPVDVAFNETLAIDFDALVIPLWRDPYWHIVG